MFNIIPLILILVSLAIIIVIVVKKFQALAALDVDSIQSERETKFKERIIGSRLKRNFFKYYSKVTTLSRPLFSATGDFFKWLYKKLVEYKESTADKSQTAAVQEGGLEKLFSEAQSFEKEDNYGEAEKKYIEIISQDSKNIKAFRFLGLLYYKEKNYQEAKQTMAHALKLLEKEADKEGEDFSGQAQIAALYDDLANVSLALENYQEGLKEINQALKIEKNNPRYLDTKIEICIIIKEKGMAYDALDRLKKANPDNKKLTELEEKIKEL